MRRDGFVRCLEVGQNMVQAVVMKVNEIVAGIIDGLYEFSGVLRIGLRILRCPADWIDDCDVVVSFEFLVVLPD